MIMLLAVFSMPSFAADETMQLRYDVQWSGIRVGQINLKLNENNGEYNYIASLDSMNLAKRLMKYWSANIATGRLTGSGYIPETYVSRWQLKKEYREMEVLFKNGKITGETIKPQDDRGKYPKVAVDVKKDSLDPVTAGVLARKKIMELRAANRPYPQDFSLDVFDGRRKFDIDVSVKGTKLLNLKGKMLQTLHLVVQRKPVAGFSSNELKRMKDENPVVDVYLDPQTYIPVWAVGKARIGSATFTLAKSCIGAGCGG